MNLIIDGSSLLHRVHWINSKRPFINSKGKNVGDIFMFLRSVKSYANMFDTKSIYVCWDKKIIYPSTNFRAELSKKEYKANRDKEKAKDVFTNEEDLTRMLTYLGIKNMYPRIMEADDVIAWLCEILDGPNIVVSADNDLLQLVSEKTSFYHSLKKKLIDLENFESTVGVKTAAYLYYKAIKGDVSDNIPGWVGFGEVKAKKIAERLADDCLYINECTDEQKYVLEHNIKLMNLEQGYNMAGEEEVKSYQEQFKQLVDLEPDLESFKHNCKIFEFNQFLKNFTDWENIFKQSRLFSILNNMFK